MDDLISRQAAIKYLMDNMTWYSEDGYETDEDEKKSAITSLINGVPSIQPVPGKWIEKNIDGLNQYACSKCGKEPLLTNEYYPIFKLSEYCPFCGAKMEVKDADSN